MILWLLYSMYFGAIQIIPDTLLLKSITIGGEKLINVQIFLSTSMDNPWALRKKYSGVSLTGIPDNETPKSMIR